MDIVVRPWLSVSDVPSGADRIIINAGMIATCESGSTRMLLIRYNEGEGLYFGLLERVSRFLKDLGPNSVQIVPVKDSLPLAVYVVSEVENEDPLSTLLSFPRRWEEVYPDALCTLMKYWKDRGRPC